MGLRAVKQPEEPEWVNEPIPLEAYDDFYDGVYDVAPVEEVKEEIEKKPPAPASRVSTDVLTGEIGKWLETLTPDQDGAALEAYDWMRSRATSCETAKASESFVLWAASHVEMAMRVILDIYDGPGRSSGEPIKAFWTYPRERPATLLDDLKIETARALVVYSDGLLWRYDDNLGIWHEVPHNTVTWAIYAYDGFRYGNPKKDGTYPQIYCTQGVASSIRSTVFEIRSKDGFFSGVRRSGIPLASGFWVAKDGRLQWTRHDPWNLLRSAYTFDWFEASSKAIQSGADIKSWPVLGDEWLDHCPIWMWMLRRMFNDSEEMARCIQEWVAASITGQATQYGQALIFVGVGGSGKGTLLKAIAQMFPAGSVCSTNPGKWREPWDRLPLVGKLLNICTETDAFNKLDPIKAVITGDDIEARRTGAASGPPFNYRPIAGHGFSCNRMPEVRGIDSATTDRFIVLPFERKFRGTADQVKEGHLLHALKLEMPGILFWVAAGLLRLQETGRITRPGCSDLKLKEWVIGSDPVARFLDEKVNLEDKSAWIPGDVFYTRFQEWCAADGLTKIIERPRLTEQLKARGINVEIKGPKTARCRAYVGVSFT